MGITSALVVFAVVWFLVLFCILPQRILTQKEIGNVIQGTPSSAPAYSNIKRKFLLTTLIAVFIWFLLCLLIIYGFISFDTMDLFKFFDPNNK
jgi:predicted secreted protein